MSLITDCLTILGGHLESHLEGLVAKMERGGAVSVQILLSVLRSLGMLENIEQLLPEPPVSPLLLRKLQGGKIQRIKRSKAN